MLVVFNKFQGYISAFLGCALLATVVVFYFTVSSLTARLDEASEALVAVRSANALLTAANVDMAKDLDTQNKAVSRLKAEGEARALEAKAALARVVAERVKWKDRYDRLLKTPEGPDSCSSVLALLDWYHALRKEEAGK